MALRGSQRKYLRGLAHNLRPVVQVGRDGLSDGVMAAFEVALDAHELVKVQFLAEKDRAAKKELAAEMETRCAAECVGRIGHMAIFFRRQEDPDRRRVTLPGEEGR